jgi:hypothetical protein
VGAPSCMLRSAKNTEYLTRRSLDGPAIGHLFRSPPTLKNHPERFITHLSTSSEQARLPRGRDGAETDRMSLGRNLIVKI